MYAQAQHSKVCHGNTAQVALPIAGGQSTPSKGNLGAALMRRFNSGTPAEQPRRSIFRAGTALTPPEPAGQSSSSGLH